MVAYKFRGAEQFQFSLDILFNQRLYCAPWSDLNDPMEGVFGYSHGQEAPDGFRDAVEQVIREKQRYRVCSLSETFDCHLLWAHYASGFSGMAIEIELPDKDSSIHEIAYRGVFAHLGQEEFGNPERAAVSILTSKYREWSYEREIRILLDTWTTPAPFYNLAQPIKRVIAGQRMLPALLEALKIICRDKGIQLFTVGIGDDGIDADPVYLD
ncbi:MAG: hypothetical protein ACO1SV_10515 [Fimbriimonas sp.]